MSTAGVAAQDIRVPLKTGFLHNGQALGNMKTCWGSRNEFEKNFLNIDPITMAYNLNSPAPEHLTTLAPCDRGFRPLPPLPISEDPSLDEADCEVEFLTSADTDFLLEDCVPSDFKYDVPGRRSFRGCGQINYAYFDSPTVSVADLSCASDQNRVVPDPNPPPPQSHRRLRRSHSGPAGSFNKPAIRISSCTQRASPSSDEDKPEIPPRVPIPPRPAKPDYRRWSAEVTSNTYSDEDRPPKVPPREPLSRSNSRTPSPKSLPSYLNGVMPPTQSFAPDPKYVSSKALQRQSSEGSAKAPCILPIIENGKKVSSTHYYLLPERPPYLDKYEKYFREAEEANPSTQIQPLPAACGMASATDKLASRMKMDVGGHGKRKHLSYVVSP
ncbi:ERBB receptor feedback inhibitor 1 isoform X2 [Rattus rattus]|uniref:ERBB receptor feedback inhibitor 1 isoform X2 n=1 Tax=Rattus rattus TaxID=10117 RepID=UPI0013F2D4C8|nr:ERBB receptor feedback inhibitor 1 isoform X2 [Rattus rattus]